MEKHSQSQMAMRESHTRFQEGRYQLHHHVEKQGQHSWTTPQSHTPRYTQNTLVYT